MATPLNGRCPKAYKKRGDDTLRCTGMKYPNDCCAHTKLCRRTGHWENSEYWQKCPLLCLKGEKTYGQQVSNHG